MMGSGRLDFTEAPPPERACEPRHTCRAGQVSVVGKTELITSNGQGIDENQLRLPLFLENNAPAFSISLLVCQNQ